MALKIIMEERKLLIPILFPLFAITESIDIFYYLTHNDSSLTKPSFQNSFFWLVGGAYG